MKWQPIETAPKGHKEMLLWTKNGAVVGFRSFTHKDMWYADIGRVGDYVKPTHWMKLPKSPDVGDA